MIRTLVEWQRIAPTRPAVADRPVRPRVQVRRSRRARAERADPRPGGPDDDLGHARLGERQQEAAVPADEHGRLHRTSPARSRPATRASSPASRSSASTGSGTSPTSGSFLQPQFNASGKIVSPANYAKLAAAGYRRHQGRQSEGARRHRRDVLERSRQEARRADRHRRPGHVREGRGTANKRLKFDAWAQHPYPFPVSSPPTQKVR